MCKTNPSGQFALIGLRKTEQGLLLQLEAKRGTILLLSDGRSLIVASGTVVQVPCSLADILSLLPPQSMEGLFDWSSYKEQPGQISPAETPPFWRVYLIVGAQSLSDTDTSAQNGSSNDDVPF